MWTFKIALSGGKVEGLQKVMALMSKHLDKAEYQMWCIVKNHLFRNT